MLYAAEQLAARQLIELYRTATGDRCLVTGRRDNRKYVARRQLSEQYDLRSIPDPRRSVAARDRDDASIWLGGVRAAVVADRGGAPPPVRRAGIPDPSGPVPARAEHAAPGGIEMRCPHELGRSLE